MIPEISATSFGSITIDNIIFDHDIIIGLDGSISKRIKKLSKEVYGTSHKISLAEAEYVYTHRAEKLLIGSGMFGRVHLSEEAKAFFDEKGVVVTLAATSKAIKRWNSASGKMIGLFHVTC